MIKGIRKLIRKFFNKQKGTSMGVKYKIGNIKYHNSHVDTLIPQLVEIGDNFISAPGSIILAHDASLFLHIRKYRCEKTTIGNNVFLGSNAIILPGITVGDGAIIGAGAVVTKNVEPYTVVGGNPAKVLCHVNDYINKCEQRDVLFQPPTSFDKFFEGDKISRLDVQHFQEKYKKDKGTKVA